MTDTETLLREALHDTADLVPVSTDPWGDYQRRTTGPDRRRTGTSRKSGGRSGRWAIAGIAAATAAVVIAAILIGSGGSRPPSQPVATQGFVLTPSGAVSSAGLHRAAVVIEDRLRGLGVQHPHVVVVGRTLQLVTPAADGSAVQAVAGSRGVLRFRQALAIDRPLETHGSPLAARGPSESPTLTAGLLRAYNNWTCKTNPNPTNGDDVTSDYIIGCDATDLKYLLAPAAIEGSGISTASAGLVNNSGQQWTVNLGFNATASRQWLNLTRTAYRVNEGQPSDPGSCQPPKGCNAIAIVLDGVVQSAPYSQTDGIPGGTAAISGTFTQHSADRLADVLKYGALPTAFAVATVPVGTTPAGQ